MSIRAKRILVSLGIAAALGIVIAAKLVPGSGSARGSNKDEGGEGGKAKVTVHQVRSGRMRDVLETTGELVAHESVAIQAEVAGRIERIAFEEGAHVRKGQLLVALDDDVLRARLGTKRKQKELAERTLKRQNAASARGAISKQALDETENRIAVLDTEIQRIQTRIRNTRIRAPFDGSVGLREVSRGDYVEPGTRIAELNMLDPLELRFRVEGRFAPRVSVDDRVEFRVDGHDERYEARVYARDSAITVATRTLRIAARVDNGGARLLPGAFADVFVPLTDRREVIAIPSAALVMSGDETFVWVARNGKAQKANVSVGLRTAERVEITKGLAPGDRVIVTGRQALEPGTPIAIDTSPNAFDIEQVEPDTERPGMDRRRLEQGDGKPSKTG